MQQNPSNLYLYSYFLSQNRINSLLINKKCRKYNGFYPSFSPNIYSLSTTKSAQGEFQTVYVNGTNFLPNNTFILFENKELPVIFYNSTQISFIVPLITTKGIHNVYAVNVYNNQFSPNINQSAYGGKFNKSNNIEYTIL